MRPLETVIQTDYSQLNTKAIEKYLERCNYAKQLKLEQELIEYQKLGGHPITGRRKGSISPPKPGVKGAKQPGARGKQQQQPNQKGTKKYSTSGSGQKGQTSSGKKSKKRVGQKRIV